MNKLGTKLVRLAYFVPQTSLGYDPDLVGYDQS